WKNIDDFIIEWPLPPTARIAILGDWGTGQQDAKSLLAAIARKNPDVVIHLGDVYYSGTDFEVDNYFLKIWKAELDLTKTRTFSLAGNHDMYSGGQAYYRMLEERRLAVRGDRHGAARRRRVLHEADVPGGHRGPVAHGQDPNGGLTAHRARQPQPVVHGVRQRRRCERDQPAAEQTGRRHPAER